VELKVIAYLGSLGTKPDTEPDVQIIGSDAYQCALVVQNNSVF
jgi:hypothetical protein